MDMPSSHIAVEEYLRILQNPTTFGLKNKLKRFDLCFKNSKKMVDEHTLLQKYIEGNHKVQLDYRMCQCCMVVLYSYCRKKYAPGKYGFFLEFIPFT